ncbi:hypothetical protein BCR34DRAFT_667071 [Clohesyomyces aquaticus]|uniref:C2H2-domain containing protein first zinc finger domain-containing protein n=1 Tax=Clohesyomyces aquaticus TaxID=1231657 RepID=A0A1Y1Z2M8_9PLEO|nr:hypothetical protein BCR34DRAFT_667071 [Clohesyomyces aquaticus]
MTANDVAVNTKKIREWMKEGVLYRFSLLNLSNLIGRPVPTQPQGLGISHKDYATIAPLRTHLTHIFEVPFTSLRGNIAIPRLYIVVTLLQFGTGDLYAISLAGMLAVPAFRHLTTAVEDDRNSISPRRTTFKRAEEPPRNQDGKMICSRPECHGNTFDRKCEWSKHMDKHERPYKCHVKGCEKLQGFTYSGGLLRHEREVHHLHTGQPSCRSWERVIRSAGGHGFHYDPGASMRPRNPAKRTLWDSFYEVPDARPSKKYKKFAGKRLKCPYYQRRPEEHSRAACRGEGFVDMAKLKSDPRLHLLMRWRMLTGTRDHLKRVHTRPLQCIRCWEPMESNAAIRRHIQQNPICETLPEPEDDRLSAERLQELNFNAAPFGQAKTMEEKWKILFRVLFPAEEHVPSPYEIPGITLHFERLFTKILEEELSEELGSTLGRAQGTVGEIIQRCKELADQASRASHSSGSSVHEQEEDLNQTGFTTTGVESLFTSAASTSGEPSMPFTSSAWDEEFGSWADLAINTVE